MNSKDRSDGLDLERWLPTTERDVEALRALRFLATLAVPDRASLAAKRGPHGEAFSLSHP